MVSDLQMNDHKIVRLADATAPADGVNKRTLDAAVKLLRSENEQLILATNENNSQRVMFLDETRVTRLERLLLRESTEPAEATEAVEPAETVVHE